MHYACMQTHSGIVKRAGPAEQVANARGVSVHTVRSWIKRDSIPAEHWAGFVADGKASLEVHPLGIGGKADPARLVFNVPSGAGINVALMDMGNRFRFLINEVDCIAPEHAIRWLTSGGCRL